MNIIGGTHADPRHSDVFTGITLHYASTLAKPGLRPTTVSKRTTEALDTRDTLFIM